MSRSLAWKLCLALCACAATTNSNSQITRNDNLSFGTRGQSLFADAGSATHTEAVHIWLLNQQVGPTNQGRIVRTPTEVPASTLQAIWQRAINTCRNYTYTVPVIGVVVSPFESECINGEVRRNYCIAPPQIGWDLCPNIFDNRRTLVYDLGPGIGPRPTQAATRSYEIGAIVTSTSDVRIGLEGMYRHDLGSVDVDFSTRAELTADRSTAAVGEVVTLSTAHAPTQPFVMASRYPFIELELNMIAYAQARAVMRHAGVNYATGDQVNTTRTLYSVDTRDNPDAIDGFVPFSNGTEELFGVRLDTSGFEARVLGVPTHVASSGYDYHLTFPWGSPDTPGRKAPKFSFPVSFSLMDFSFTPPRLDTPALTGFECGLCEGPLRSFNPGDGTITSTTPLGTRDLIGGITDGSGIVVPWVNEGRQDVDLVRFDIDVDVITAAVGAPLGVVVTDPLGLIEVELNLLDLDLANFLSVDQRLRFDPNLHVELQFSSPVEVRRPGDLDFVRVSSRVLRVGESLQYRQPASAVTITPVYTLRNNEFVNDTQLMVTSAIQETLMQTKLSGIIPDLAAELLGQPLNMALLQLTPELLPPQAIVATDTAPWTLGGFADVTGTAVMVALPSSGGAGSSSGGGSSGGGSSGGGSSGGGSSGGGSGSGGGGSGSSSGGGSGGGGALEGISVFALFALALVTSRSRRLRVEGYRGKGRRYTTGSPRGPRESHCTLQAV